MQEFDGNSRRVKGKAAYGFAVYLEESRMLLMTGNGVLPPGTTNNEAEYQAMIAGLKVG